MSDERLERLELRLAWLESTKDELSHELYRQQREIETLRLRVTQLQDRLEAALAEAAEEQTPFDPATERPPHY